jgi:DNA polymerase
MAPQEEHAAPFNPALLADLVRAGVTDVVAEVPFAWKKSPVSIKKSNAKPDSSPSPSPSPAQAKLWLTGTPTRLLILTGALEKDEGALPFTPQEDQLLTNMLAAIGIDRADVGVLAIAVADKHGTAFAQDIKEQLIKPTQEHMKKQNAPALLALGQVAAWFAQGQDLPLGDARDQAQAGAFSRRQPVGVTYHPRTLLRQPLLKRLAWQDLLAFQAQREALS